MRRGGRPFAAGAGRRSILQLLFDFGSTFFIVLRTREFLIKFVEEFAECVSKSTFTVGTESFGEFADIFHGFRRF